MNIHLINKDNLPILLNLVQAYEAEFSLITNKNPGPNGIYPMDTPCDEDHPSFLLYDNSTPIAFCIKGTHDGRHDIAEFFVIPTYRKNGIGQKFAIEIFKKYPGNWQVRQIDGAHKATDFWRKTIRAFTNNNFSESIVDDPYWGKVTRQTFISK